MGRDLDFSAHEDGVRLLLGSGLSGIQRIDGAIVGDVLRAKDLEQCIAHVLRSGEPLFSEDQAGHVTDLLLSLSMLSRTRKPAVLIRDLRRTLAGLGGVDEAESAWDEMCPALEKLLSNDTLLSVGKAVQLQYEHSKLLTDAYVITDVRPVFNGEGSKPKAALICHTLRIAYLSDGKTENISLALDDSDVRYLGDECERALSNGEAMSAYLREPFPLPSARGGNDDT